MLTAETVVRRALFASTLALVALTATAASRGGSDRPAAAPTKASIEPSNRWLSGLKATHKQFFDAPNPNGGVPLVHMMNYYDTYNKAFGVKDADINAVLTFYGATTFYGLNDAMWAKYKLGEFLETVDPATNQPAVANPWRTTPTILGMTIPAAGIEALHGRGATFILCNNALGIFSGILAQKRGLDPKLVYEDMKANILPGVDLVPGMVIAVEQAQRAGLSYHRQ